jgi:hypothetical protein
MEITKLYEIFDDLAPLKPEIVDVRKDGVYAYNMTVDSDVFFFYAPDDFDFEFSMEYSQSEKIIKRLKGMKPEDIKQIELVNGVMKITGSNFGYEIQQYCNRNEEVPKLFKNECEFVPVTNEFLDGLKVCLVLSKISKKSRAKDLIVDNGQMVVNEGTMLVIHKAQDMGKFSINDKASALINTIQPSSFCVLKDKLLFEYGGSYVILPKIGYETKNPVIEKINNLVLDLISINAEMVSKLSFIGKLSKIVKIKLFEEKLSFSSMNPSAFEECDVPDCVGEFEASFNYSSIQHFFMIDNQFDVTKFGIGEPMLIVNQNYTVFISNLK